MTFCMIATEELAYHAPVSKHHDAFYMYLFADDKNENISKAKRRFEETNGNGEWILIIDETDQYMNLLLNLSLKISTNSRMS